jgi:aryl sulfotransferase
MAKKNEKKKPPAKRARSVRRKRLAWPPKTREIQNAIFDSTRWNGFVHRPDDIVIVTWAKAGTTWMQQIVSQIVCGAPDGVGLLFDSPWLDMRGSPLDQVVAGLEAQTHRRFIKTHLPVDALAYAPTVKYIYVVRDARDVVWSAHNHHSSFTDEALAMFSDTPGRVGPPLTRPRSTCAILSALSRARARCRSFVEQFWKRARLVGRSTRAERAAHALNDLKADLASEVRRIARFLGLSIPRGRLSAIVEHCSFDYMRREFAKLDLMHHFQRGRGSVHPQGHERPVEGTAVGARDRALRCGGRAASLGRLRALGQDRRAPRPAAGAAQAAAGPGPRGQTRAQRPRTDRQEKAAACVTSKIEGSPWRGRSGSVRS